MANAVIAFRAMAVTPPALTFASSDLEVVVLPALGGRLHRLRYRGHDLLRTPPNIDEHRRDPFFYGAYVMAPWCNRLAPGQLEVAGRTVDLPINFSDGSAIHGQVFGDPLLPTHPIQSRRRYDDAVVLRLGGFPQQTPQGDQRYLYNTNPRAAPE